MWIRLVEDCPEGKKGAQIDVRHKMAARLIRRRLAVGSKAPAKPPTVKPKAATREPKRTETATPAADKAKTASKD